MPLYRHGDVLVQRVAVVPPATPVDGLVLAWGELTGHAHRIAETDGRARLLRSDEGLFLEITDTATLVHDEHGPIALAPGAYRVWRQREYVPPDERQDPIVGFRPISD